MLILSYLSFIVMGLSLGLLGGGGSILTIPILVYLLKIEPMRATEYSLFVVGSTAFFGGFTYFRRKEVDIKTGIIFALPSFLGVYVLRSFVLPILPDELFKWGTVSVGKSLFIMMAFAVLMLTAASSMIRKKKGVELDKPLMSQSRRFLVIGTKGLMVGAVTGLVGAGGGFLIIPALVVLIGMPMRIAVGTSLLIIAANSLLGFFAGLAHQSNMDWRLLLTVTGIALIGILLGSHFAEYVPETKLKKGFGVFTLIMGSFILIDQLSRL